MRQLMLTGIPIDKQLTGGGQIGHTCYEPPVMISSKDAQCEGSRAALCIHQEYKGSVYKTGSNWMIPRELEPHFGAGKMFQEFPQKELQLSMQKNSRNTDLVAVADA